MVGTIRLSGKDYRWVYGVRASYIYQTLFGAIQDGLKIEIGKAD